MTDSTIPTANKASKSNPALAAFEILVGEWLTAAKHPMFPGVELKGRTFFQWTEGGAFLMMQSTIDHEKFPDNLSVFGSDDALRKVFMLYFDERGVSRKQDVEFENNVLKWWRNAPGFSQRYKFTISPDGNTITGNGELSTDDQSWQPDLDTVYTRVTRAQG